MIHERVDNFANIAYVFLDRDGVLNRNLPDGGFVASWEQFEFLPGVEEAVGRLNRSGRKVIVVTNQRGIALGLYTEADLHTLHECLQEHFAAHGCTY
jgi:D-glycero-D-manno-heptose 1,7-bisphosphate phosphatase